MRTRTKPARTCVGCGEGSDKRELIRIVRTSEGDVTVDPSGKANGRGAYVHPAASCFETAARRKRFAAALRVDLHDDDIDRLRQEFERLLPTEQDANSGTVNLNA